MKCSADIYIFADNFKAFSHQYSHDLTGGTFVYCTTYNHEEYVKLTGNSLLNCL